MRTSPFVMLCSAGLFAIFSSTISKSPVLPLFATHLGADPAGVGFIASVSAFTGIIASIPAGLLSDRIGRKRMLVFALIIFASAPFLYPLATRLWHLAVIRFYHGFATAIFIPVAMAMVADLFQEERGEKLGWFSTATLIGRFMAPLAGGSIIGAMVSDQGLGYRVVYLVCGGAGIIALFLTMSIASPSRERGEKRSWKETFTAFRSVISSRTIILTCTVEASILFAYGTFETFLPLYSMQKGLTAYHVGIFLSAQVITLALMKPLMGKFSDRHGRKPQIILGAILGAFCIGGFSLFESFLPLFVISILFGFSLSVVTSATSAFIADLSRQETRGSAMGVLGSIMDIGHTTGPLGAGIIATYFGIAKAFIGVSMVLLLAAGVFWIRIVKDKEKN